MSFTRCFEGQLVGLSVSWRKNYATTVRHLSLLKKEGVVVTERLSGKTRFFRFTSMRKAGAVMKLLEEWEFFGVLKTVM
jgi:hypothetical protein